VVEVLAHRPLNAATQSAAQSSALGRCHARQHHAPPPDNTDPHSVASAKKSLKADRGNEWGAREQGGASLVQDLLPGRLALGQNFEPVKKNPLESRRYYVPQNSATGSLRANEGSRDAWRVRGLEWPRGEARRRRDRTFSMLGTAPGTRKQEFGGQAYEMAYGRPQGSYENSGHFL